METKMEITELFAEYANVKISHKNFIVIINVMNDISKYLVTFGDDADKLNATIKCEYEKVNGLSVAKTKFDISDVLVKLIGKGYRVAVLDI